MMPEPNPRSGADPTTEPPTPGAPGEPERAPGGWLEAMIQRVDERRRERFEEARQAGARWLVECYDRWEFPRGEEGADLFFEICATDAEVDALVARFAGEPWNEVAGIYDLARPLAAQRGGLSPEAWGARRRPRA